MEVGNIAGVSGALNAFNPPQAPTSAGVYGPHYILDCARPWGGPWKVFPIQSLSFRVTLLVKDSVLVVDESAIGHKL